MAGSYVVSNTVKSTSVGSEISCYVFPALPILVRGYLKEHFCHSCGQMASGLGAALVFCRERDHAVVWAHAGCLKGMSLQLETPAIAVHPEVQNLDFILDALSKAQLPGRGRSSLATSPFRFGPAKSGWRLEQIAAPTDPTGPVDAVSAEKAEQVASATREAKTTANEQEGQKPAAAEAAEAGTKRVLRVGTSDPAEPVPASAADQVSHVARAKKEAKASDEQEQSKPAVVEQGDLAAAGPAVAESDAAAAADAVDRSEDSCAIAAAAAAEQEGKGQTKVNRLIAGA